MFNACVGWVCKGSLEGGLGRWCGGTGMSKMTFVRKVSKDEVGGCGCWRRCDTCGGFGHLLLHVKNTGR
jgi:hypothetical protein